MINLCCLFFFFSSRRRHTRYWRDWSSDVCSSDLQTRVRHLELVALHEHTALLVLVTDAVKVRQQVITLPQPVTQPELSRLANRLSETWSGLPSQDVAAHPSEPSTLEATVAAVVAEILAEEDAAAFAEARVEGLRDVLSQPEFSRSEKLLDLMEAVDERNLPKVIPAESVAEDGVTVIIGAENPNDSMRECSIVITSYGTPEGHKGAIAVLGPTRDRKSTRLNSSHANISYA